VNGGGRTPYLDCRSSKLYAGGGLNDPALRSVMTVLGFHGAENIGSPATLIFIRRASRPGTAGLSSKQITSLQCNPA
jgi:hypothetical protein